MIEAFCLLVALSSGYITRLPQQGGGIFRLVATFTGRGAGI